MASRKPLRTRGLPGQVAVIFVVAISCLLIAVGLGVDVSTAYSAKTGQEAVLEAVRQSSLGMSNAVKYSENPGREAREEVVERTTDTPAPPRSGMRSCPSPSRAPTTATRAST